MDEKIKHTPIIQDPTANATLSPLSVVLYEPEIPQNTGSIARTCAATETALHLVGKLGFELDERKIRRAGLDYWPWVKLFQHESWEAFTQNTTPRKLWYLSSFGKRLYYEADFAPGDMLVFGSETKGLPRDLTASVPQEQLLTIPMPCPAVRSLNLSNAASIVVYEARRQLGLDKGLFSPRVRG